MRNAGLTGINNIDLLLTEVNTDLMQRPIAPETAAAKLAWMRSGGPIGQKTVYELPFFSNRSKKRGVYEEIPGTVPQVANFSSTIDLWAPDAEIIPALTKLTDLYGIVEGHLPTIIAQGMIELDRQFAELIANGITTKTEYDNKTFFATDHECNPNIPGLKTFGNYNAGRALNYDGVNATFEDLDQMPGPDSNLLAMPGEMIIFCSTNAQAAAARTLMNGGLIPNSAGTATQSNPLQGMASVMKITALRGFGSGKYWGIAKIVSEKHRPFSFSQAMPLQAYIEGLSINDHVQAIWSAAKQGVKDAHGFGYLWPHLCVLNVEP